MLAETLFQARGSLYLKDCLVTFNLQMKNRILTGFLYICEVVAYKVILKKMIKASW